MNLFIFNFFKKKKKHSGKLFYEQLNKSLRTNDPPLGDLFDDLEDNYCEGGKLLGKNIYLGCIYMFSYRLKDKSEYNKVVRFIDPTPMVLVTGYKDGLLRGINLNLCTRELKVLILNILNNLDEPFFLGDYVKMCDNKKAPLSKKVLLFMDKDGEAQIIAALQKHFNNVDYGAVFRTYSVKNIINIKFMEWYILPYIPDIEYTSISTEIMKQFWKLSNISTIKM